MKELAKTVSTNLDAAWRATCLAIDQAVVLATPVDTGRARANWRVSTEKQSDVYDAYYKGKAGSTGGQNSAQALADGAEAIAGATGDTIYISNNLPYIEVLNDGSSAQAPAGFVEQAVQAGQEVIQRMKVLG